MDKFNLDELFHQAKNEAPEVSFEETKAQFTHSVNQLNSTSPASGVSSLFTIKTWTIMITTLITTIGIGAFLWGPNSVQKEVTTHLPKEKLEWFEPENTISQIETEVESFNENPSIEQNEVKLTEEALEVAEKSPVKTRGYVNTASAPLPEENTDSRKPFKSEYHYPTLTPKEIKTNNLRKIGSIKSLIKTLKKGKAFIPRGQEEINGIMINIDKLYMKTAEVANIDYRVFLFDLLIQGRKQDFREAEPGQLLWLKYDSSFVGLKEMYFSHPEYDYYPVINISRKAAEMYCKWLTEVTNEYLIEKGKPIINEVRIPSNAEWTYAARGGIGKSAYPWGGPYARNAEGCYLANFNPEEGMDTDGGFSPVNVYSYSPNDYGLYCMSGNVAEMVYYNNDKTQPGARGGSWTSPVQDIQINGEDKFKGITTPNVNIGFRWVVSYGESNTRELDSLDLSDKMGSYDSYGEFHFPQLNEKEEKYYAKSKTQMIDKAGDYNNSEFVLFKRDTLLFDQDSVHFKDVSIQSTEVTNLEYRTFLIDLLKQGKKKEYIDALPDVDVWSVDSVTIIMSKNYFPYSGYDEYPVVGVTPKGVALFCEWYTTEVDKFFNSTPIEIKSIQIRIPTVTEWQDAASDNGRFNLYPWDGQSPTKTNGKYMANYYPEEGENPGIDGTFMTNSVKAYPSTSKKLFGMSGNVAEITTGPSNTIVVKGGSWKSSPEQIQIYYSQNNTNHPLPNSETGFRPVLVYEYHYSLKKYEHAYPTKQ